MYIPRTLQSLTLDLANEAAKKGFSVEIKFRPLVDMSNLNMEQMKYLHNIWDKIALGVDERK